jgi:hypothetical protein
MEGIEKPHPIKYKDIMNDWNYDASFMLTSLPVQDLENFKCLVFVVQSVQPLHMAVQLLLCVIKCIQMTYWMMVNNKVLVISGNIKSTVYLCTYNEKDPP